MELGDDNDQHTVLQPGHNVLLVHVCCALSLLEVEPNGVVNKAPHGQKMCTLVMPGALKSEPGIYPVFGT